MKRIVIITLAVLALAGCNQQANVQVDQSKLCAFSTDVEAKACKAGELAWFRPSTWGNEQLPLNVAAAYCDFNYDVMYNNAGVLCVFTDKRLSMLN
ncbi:lipoprotein [Photobacterium sp. DNB22_13_2]